MDQVFVFAFQLNFFMIVLLIFIFKFSLLELDMIPLDEMLICECYASSIGFSFKLLYSVFCCVWLEEALSTYSLAVSCKQRLSFATQQFCNFFFHLLVAFYSFSIMFTCIVIDLFYDFTIYLSGGLHYKMNFSFVILLKGC